MQRSAVLVARSTSVRPATIAAAAGSRGYSVSPLLGATSSAQRHHHQVQKEKVAVFGAGSFGTALGTLLARNGLRVVLLTNKEHVAAFINAEHRNPSVLSDYKLPYNLSATTSPEKALTGATLIVHAVPVQASLDYLRNLSGFIPENVPIVSTSKGLHTETLQVMSDLIPSALGRDHPTAFLSGPTFAKELMEGWPSGAVAASEDLEIARRVQHVFSSERMRVYTTTDVVGVEVGGALKNVYAIGSGAVEGLGLGLNTTALLCSRGIVEMQRLAAAMAKGGKSAALSPLAGMGDLMLTCFGALSRNRSVGVRLGKGESITSIIASMSEVAEGVATAPAALRLAERHGVNVPIIKAVNKLIQGDVTAAESLFELMMQPAADEGLDG